MTPGPMLLVDDDEVFRERLAQALRQRGQEVVTAADGDAAVRAAGRGKLAAAVVDLRMPGMTGRSWSARCCACSPSCASSC